MNIILFDSKSGDSRTIRLRPSLIMFVVSLLFVLCAVAGSGVMYWFNEPRSEASQDWVKYVKQDLAESAENLAQTRERAENQMTAMTVRLAELQARLMRLDALGERLVGVADLEGGEFDFTQQPALGGPNESELIVDARRPSFLAELDQLAADIAAREQQLEIMESLLANRKIRKEVSIAGRPVTWGWLSSRFGRRTDPFTGRPAWHSGVDFAGKEGADIVSVGSGVVTWAGDRYGYGLMVEVNHGEGYSTRYAHAKEIVVQVGDIVEHGQTLAKIGSTGRSTGPHVHFEVRKHGKAVDPARFVRRNRP